MEKKLLALILGAIKVKLGEKVFICGICGGTRWSISDGVYASPVQENIGGGVVFSGRVLPKVDLICEVCGNSISFNLVKLLGKAKWDELLDLANNPMTEIGRNPDMSGSGEAKDERSGPG